MTIASVTDQPLENATKEDNFLHTLKKYKNKIKEKYQVIKDTFNGGEKGWKRVLKFFDDVKNTIDGAKIKECLDNVKKLFIEVKNIGTKAFDDLKSINSNSHKDVEEEQEVGNEKVAQ